MIVISTYNGKEKLKNLLDDIKSFNINNKEVCIVDNNSPDLNHREYLKELEKEEYIVLYNPRNLFELGGFNFAINNIEADVWFFLQDSIRLKYNIFEEIIPKLTDTNIYTFLTFEANVYDDMYDKSFLLINFGTTKYPKGVAGLMMFAKDSVVKKIKKDFKLTRTKEESNGMNRGISIILERHGIEINEMGFYKPEKFYDPDAYPFFCKQ